MGITSPDSKGKSALILAFPGHSSPVINPSRRGRLPRGVTSLSVYKKYRSDNDFIRYLDTESIALMDRAEWLLKTAKEMRRMMDERIRRNTREIDEGGI